jgi:outer membrane immunogenic protein
MPAPVAPQALVYSWTGFYAGGNAGALWGPSSATAIGGGQIGYNWQSSWLLLGAETDIQGMALRHSEVLTNAIAHSVTANTSANYLGTVRGRVGVARGRWLTYFTGGLAYTTVNHDGSGVVGISGNYSGSDSKIGYAFGSGVEWAFLDRWSAKAEYLYVFANGQTDTYTTTSHPIAITYGNTSLNMVRLGVNYRFLP